MSWDVSVGDTASGLGVVIEKKQMRPDGSEDVRFSGYNGQLVLIVRTEQPHLPSTSRFIITKWLYGEKQPEEPFVAVNSTLTGILLEWELFTRDM